MKIALVYDWIYTFGGAERILLALHELFPEAPLYTAVYDQQETDWADSIKIKPSFLQYFPFAKKHHELFPFLTPIAFESFDFSNFNVVISITSCDAKGIITKPQTLHICYMLTPTRYLWSHYNFYFSNKLLRFFTKPGINYLKTWDKITKSRPDYLFAISKTVQARIKKYYQRECEIIYPPIQIDSFTQSHQQANKGNYYLVVSRLVSYKRIDIAVEAFNQLGLPLVIIGEGRFKNRLRNKAQSNIKFISNLTDEELISYYHNCRAVIITAEEDFGIVSVEAQAAGKPVIAYRLGGSSETVKDGITGILFDKQNVKYLIDAIKRFEQLKILPEACYKNSLLFSKEKFKKVFSKKMHQLQYQYFC